MKTSKVIIVAIVVLILGFLLVYSQTGIPEGAKSLMLRQADMAEEALKACRCQTLLLSAFPAMKELYRPVQILNCW